MTVTWLIDEGTAPSPVWLGDRDAHLVVRTIRALDSGSADWSPIISEYESQAHTWLPWTLSVPGYFAPIERALQYLDVPPPAAIVELCSGSSPIPDSVAPLAGRTIVDGSEKMLKAASAIAHRVCAMVNALPLRDGVASLVVVLNGTLDVKECRRILTNGGSIVVGWTFGIYTPMYQPWADLLSELPTDWNVVLGRGQWGEFGILRQS